MLDKTGEIVVRLLKNEPIQYILGEAYFYGMNLKVNRSTLIPRPETEELADLIIQENGSRKDLRVLDIGTGSGAIAIALSRNLPFADVMAIDISSDALRTAEENAESLHCRYRIVGMNHHVCQAPPFKGMKYKTHHCLCLTFAIYRR